MKSISLKAMAKINLGLDVVRKREDGYHEVRMIMQTVDLYDTLTFQKEKNGGIYITANIKGIPTDKRNLIYKTAQLLMDRFQITEGVRIHLEKRIPVAAGMAGGSTDAAATFVGMNQLFELELSPEELRTLGVKIGADVPYCILGGTALSEGIGEKLTSLLDAPQCYLLIAKPDINVSTKYVYENLHADRLQKHPDIDGMIRAIEEHSLEGIVERMENVLETVTIKKYPVIQEIKQFMEQAGAKKALMSGSGPTVFGIYERQEEAKLAADKLQGLGLAKQIFTTTFVSETCVATEES